MKQLALSNIKNKCKEKSIDFIFYIIGSAIYAASVTVFSSPNKMAPGGFTGIATILHYVMNVPIGASILVLNIPFFILAFRFIGGEFIFNSLICTVLTSVGVDALNFLPKYDGGHGNMLLAALYGGVLSGIGLGMIFIRSSTTGGTDIASKLLRLKFPHIPMGRMLLILDSVVILVSIIVFKSVNSGLYAIITLYVSSKVIDAMLYGSDNGKMIIVISEKNSEIADAVASELDRGVTLLSGKGFYTGSEREVLLCAVRRPEASRLMNIVRKTDPSAFIIICEADQVVGEGFRPITKKD